MFYLSDAFIDNVLTEDIPLNDCTTESLGISKEPGRLRCYPKKDGVVSGVTMAARLLEKAGMKVLLQAEDGEIRKAREVVLEATGKADQIHAVYKTAQNVMEYSSGISGRARAMVEAARKVNPNVMVAVTRKHFPGTKKISLSAALAGGAIVHRAGLSESILIFDQHRVFSQDFEEDFRRAKIHEPEKKLAVEADNYEDAMKFAEYGADIVQCERFDFPTLAKFVTEAKKRFPNLVINAAGGINADNAAEAAATGVDVLVTSWVYFGKPFDIKMEITACR